MSEEKDDYIFGTSDEVISKLRNRIESLESRLKEANDEIARIKDSTMPWTRGFGDGHKSRDKEIQSLEARLSQAEAKLQIDCRDCREGDGSCDKMHMPSGTIKMFIVNLQEQNTELQNRLSTLEMIHKQCLLRDAERLSHLMDVAGKFGKVLGGFAEEDVTFHDDPNGAGDWQCHNCLASQPAVWMDGKLQPKKTFQHHKGCQQQEAKLLIAEWDGIKSEERRGE